MVGGAKAGLSMPLQGAGPAGSAEAEHQNPAISAACHQQVTTWGALTAHSIAFHLWRKTEPATGEAVARTPHYKGGAEAKKQPSTGLALHLVTPRPKAEL